MQQPAYSRDATVATVAFQPGSDGSVDLLDCETDQGQSSQNDEPITERPPERFGGYFSLAGAG